MRYLMIYHPDPNTAAAPPSQQLVTEMGAYIEEMTRAGTLLSTGGTCGPSAGLRVRRANGKVTVTDGPYAEAKELVGGYALVKCNSRDEAIAHAKRFLSIVGSGESEIHELMDEPVHP